VQRITTVFFISIYGLSALAGSMLAFAEGTFSPELFSAAIAVLAYVCTERTQKLHLPVLWANALGLIAFVFAGRQMFGETIEERLLAGAHLLVYLSWIVILQKKGLPQYWWMCALSVLEVAVGSILTNASVYGGMLVGFMFAAIWTLSILSLYQAHLQYGENDRLATDPESGVIAGEVGAGWSQQGKDATIRARSLFRSRSIAEGSIQLDPGERWLGTRFSLSMMAVSSAALVIAAGFFLFIPRLWAGRSEWNPEGKQYQITAMTGFSNRVTLGEFIPLLESSRRALQIALFDEKGQPMDVDAYCNMLGYAEPLFRGSAMVTYEMGAWASVGRQPPLAPISKGRRVGVRQQILLEPMGTPVLFAIEPTFAIRLPNPQDQADHQLFTDELLRPDQSPLDKAISYEAFSSGSPVQRFGTQLDPEHLAEYRALPPGQLGRLVALAKKLTNYEKTHPAGEMGAAKWNRHAVDTLVAYLRDSGTFSYSLDTSLQDPDLDPVEDFLLNRKTGHCEYFASALTLMLRGVGIPARVVTGFKGGGVNAINGMFEVEQRHAHAWVEAYLSPDVVWVTADPTPASRDESVESFASKMGTAHELASVVTSTWSRLVNIDIEAQQAAFYSPIMQTLRTWWYPTQGSRPLVARILQGIVEFARDPTQWFTLMGLAIATAFGGFIAVVFFVFRMRRSIWKALGWILKRRRLDEAIRVAFYVRFETACAQLGLVRTPQQTQREFARTVGPRIRNVVASSNGLAEFPPRLVDLFYRVRFGDENLPPADINDLDRKLTTLERLVRNPGRG
jgi:hypothetical protein